jgi:hypothetical protein
MSDEDVECVFVARKTGTARRMHTIAIIQDRENAACGKKRMYFGSRIGAQSLHWTGRA